MTPAQAIGALDRQLAKHGQKVTLRRYTAQSGSPRPKVEVVDIPGFVRVAKPEEMVGDIDAAVSNVTLSPTHVGAFWPIVETDKVVIGGRECSIKPPVEPVFMNDVLVRVNLKMSG